MSFKVFKNTVLLFVLVLISCGNVIKSEEEKLKTANNAKVNKYSNTETQQRAVNKILQLSVGANQTEAYLSILKGKRVGIVANQTSVIFKIKNESLKGKSSYTHLVDSLLALNVMVKKVLAPEHGFRGIADAGEHIKDGVDAKTGVPIVSLYGDNKKPKPEQLNDLDIVIFDIQDVGARFYTYISTLHYVMEACAEAQLPLLILDRPNPNGAYIDGPILEKENSSFVGMHPIPIVHGLTIGEYAQMINGEKWLKNGIQCDLKIIAIQNYTHQTPYSLPIKPSPNLPNDKSINLYPSLCFFEGTNVSVGRGTNSQFQVFGSPFLDKAIFKFAFTPKPNEGAKQPPYQDKLCYGNDLKNTALLSTINLEWLISAYQHTTDKKVFFNSFFVKLAGTKKLQQQIEVGLSEKAIKATWQPGLETYKQTRLKYLIYK